MAHAQIAFDMPRCLLDSDDNRERTRIEEATKPALLLLYIHGKSTVVTIISKIGVFVCILESVRSSVWKVSTVHVANGGLLLLK